MSETDQLSKIFIENWVSVFNTILGKEVTIAVESAKQAESGELASNFEEFAQFVRIDYGDDDLSFIIMSQNNKMISIVSNLMIGLDTFAEEINDDDRDAFVEAINQLYSACQIPILDSMGVDVKFKNIRFVSKEEASEMTGKGSWFLWTVGIDFSDISKETYTVLIPDPFSSAVATKSDERRVDDNSVDTSASQTHNKINSVSSGNSNIDLLMDVELPVTIRIGSTEMKLIDIMRLGLGSIIELEKLVDDPVEVMVNDTLVAKGEVVVYDSNFAIRITQVESRADRIRSLG